ncbi:MAG: cofactor-independent phosphoglycerate mutase [bacterium]
MKYIMAIPDGAADSFKFYPDGNTPLKVANTPMMDELADHGEVGWAKTVPDHLPPGSDVACLSIFGFNPAEVYTGRAPIEAASLGIQLGDLHAFRCNLVTIQNGRMKEFTAGHISTDEASALIDSLNEKIGIKEIRFYTGVQYRHILTTTADYGQVSCTPPHDILDKEIEPYLPQGESRERILELMRRSGEIFADHAVNRQRIEQGKPPATQIWLWGQGTEPQLPPYSERCGLTGGVISAVDLIRGIGKLAGLEVIHVPGATGLMDTNYEGKADAALDVLSQQDFVCVHVEAPDEMGHAGDEARKTQSLTDFDHRMLRRLIEGLRSTSTDFRILLLPDHPTPISLRTHVNEPVPFLLYDSRTSTRRGDTGYSEWGVRERTRRTLWGYRLLDVLAERALFEDKTLYP